MLEEYFGKNKSLRHISQHLFIDTLGFSFAFFIFEDLQIKDVLIFFVASFAIDLDHFITLLFVRKEKYLRYTDKAVDLLKRLKLKELLEFLSENHKTISGLLLHNIPMYLTFIVLFAIFYYLGQRVISLILLGFITHQTFDLFDDLKLMGNIDNWLWRQKSDSDPEA